VDEEDDDEVIVQEGQGAVNFEAMMMEAEQEEQLREFQVDF
jgi:hypothetical protein